MLKMVVQVMSNIGHKQRMNFSSTINDITIHVCMSAVVMFSTVNSIKLLLFN